MAQMIIQLKYRIYTCSPLLTMQGDQLIKVDSNRALLRERWAG